jgi:ribonuclease HI
VVIEDDQGTRLRTFHRFIGIRTNNEAEYQALIDGLKAVADWKPDRLEIYLDSKLVVEQVNGSYRVKKPELLPLYNEVKHLLGGFADTPEIKHVERESNKGADKLANMALDEQVKKAAPRG